MAWQTILDRLGTGERWWAAEIVLRTAGLALVVAGVLAVLWLYRSVHHPPHPAKPLELLAATVAVVGGCGGSALACEGPSLFRHVPIPGHGIHPPSTGESRHE